MYKVFHGTLSMGNRVRITAREWVYENTPNLAKNIIKYRLKGGFVVGKAAYENVSDKENLSEVLERIPYVKQVIVTDKMYVYL